MSSVFSRIIGGEIPCYFIGENDSCFAFLDINPLTRGHILVVPKMEVDKLFDLSEEDYSNLWAFARRVAIALEKAIPCNRVGVTVIGLEVPHAHIHLLPLKNMSDINFLKPKLSLPPEEMESIAQKIRLELANLAIS